MKKLLISIVIVLLIVLIGVTVVKGFEIGNLRILGVIEIKDENEKLDATIQEATKLASTDYQRKITELNDEIKRLQAEKTEYEDMVSVSTESEVQAANQSYDNMIEFLFVRIENHAKSEGVKIDLAVTSGSSGAENVYNLNFTAVGSYVGIEEFITDIEDDSKLGYKIEDFKMKSSSQSSNTVEATFVCRDITIGGISSNRTSGTPNRGDITQMDTTMNGTNTTNNTSTTNTTE